MYDDGYRVLDLLCVDEGREGHVNLFEATLRNSKDEYTSTRRLSQGLLTVLVLHHLTPDPPFRLSLPPINFLLCPSSATPAWPSIILLLNNIHCIKQLIQSINM